MTKHVKTLLCGLVIAAATFVAGCDGGDTVVMPPVPAESGQPEIVIEPYVDTDPGAKLEYWGGSDPAMARAVTLRVQLKNGATANAMTFCLMSSIGKNGWRGWVYGGYTGVPNEGYDENLTPDGAIVFSAQPRDVDNHVHTWQTQGALADGKTTIRIDTTQFAGLDEFLVELGQGGYSDGRINLTRLFPNANGSCGATGIAVDGVASRITVRFPGAEVTSIGPQGSVYPQGVKG